MYAFETHAYEPMKRTKNPTFTMTYVTQPRLWNGHMYLAKFLLVGGATMLVFGVCVCVSKSVSKTHDQQIVLAVWQRWVHKVETIIFLYNGMLESWKEMDTLMYEEIMTHENTNMGG